MSTLVNKLMPTLVDKLWKGQMAPFQRWDIQQTNNKQIETGNRRKELQR